jgi:hypothetical protein
MGPEDDFGSRRRHQLGAKRSLALSDKGPLRSSYSSSNAEALRKATSRSPRASLAEQDGATNDDAADFSTVAAAAGGGVDVHSARRAPDADDVRGRAVQNE